MRFILLGMLAAPALAAPQRNADNHCYNGIESVVFHCSLSNGKWIDICADNQSANPTYFQYRFGAKGKIELQKPELNRMNLANWSYEETARARGMERMASFTNDAYGYDVLVSEAGDDTFVGMVISKDGKSIATLACANGVVEHLDKMEGFAGGSYKTLTTVGGLEGEERFVGGVRGRFGRMPECDFAVTERGPASQYHAVVSCDGGARQALELGGHSGFSLDALVPVDMDANPETVEMAIAASYISGAGPEGAVPWREFEVLAFDGEKLRRLDAERAKLETTWKKASGDPARALQLVRDTYGVP